MLSDDDLDIRNMSDDELTLAWDLWFDLAQTTNDDDPPYTHGVFQTIALESSARTRGTQPTVSRSDPMSSADLLHDTD